jgi:hypothetical protein
MSLFEICVLKRHFSDNIDRCAMTRGYGKMEELDSYKKYQN